jgi:HAD superfamily hydrolase (TIGR01549 family)
MSEFRARAVVFDLDGTLVDSMPLVLAAVGYALAPYGERTPTEILASLGGPPARFLGRLLADAAHVPAALERMESYHRENAHLIVPFGAVGAALPRLAQAVRLGLWTGRDRESTLWLLAQHRLAAHFGVTLCGDDLSTHKPDPEGLHYIMRRLAVAPEETLFVGDADVDVIGGAAAGARTILIRSGRPVTAEVLARAWSVVETPAEALQLAAACT